MIIKIETDTEEEQEKVFEYFKEKCLDALNGSFEISIEDTKLKYKQEKKE